MPGEVLERKKALGRSASYSILASRTGLPQTTIYCVVTECGTAIPISDAKQREVLFKCSDVLTSIEEESSKEASM